MQDSNSRNIDGFSILCVLLISLTAATGFSSAASILGSKDEAIALLKQQLAESERGLSQCQSEFSGYEKGRR